MINARLNATLRQRSSSYWLEKLESMRIPCAPVNTFSEALTDPQVLYRNMVVDLAHPNGKSTRGPGNPIKLSRTRDETFAASPLLGQHTQQVLSQLLDYDADTIKRLRSSGVIA